MINIKKGNLLSEKVDALVNAVNCVGVMGKEIALQFKNKWPDYFIAYAKSCKAGAIRPGVISTYALNQSGQPFYIINFPTKNNWRDKSTLAYIKDGLDDLKIFIEINNIRSLALPALGCGNGGLEWSIVKPLIEASFSSLKDIDIYLFEPNL